VQNPVDSGAEGEVRQGRAIAEAAQSSGVRHFIYSSVIGADKHTGIPFFESKGRIEEHVRNLGMPYTILRPAYFMENWLGMKDRIAAGEIALPLAPGHALQQIAVDDIGGIAAAALERAGKWQGRAVEIAGDETTMEGIAALLGRAAGREVRYRQLDWDRFEEQAGADYTRMYRWLEDSPVRVDIPALRGDYSRLTSMANWIEQQRWEMAGGAPQRG
jgi:uncharacterized protein YbjT (DUF2867 family)